MAQKRLVGKRCRAVQMINTHEGLVPPNTYGTLRHEIENLGRHLVFVEWDNGLAGYVFPKEIEFCAPEDRPTV